MPGKWRFLLCIFMILASGLSSCGPRDKPDPTALPYTPRVIDTESADTTTKIVGDPEAGAMVYELHCSSCHSLDEGVNIAGPSLFQAGESMTYDYIKQSIANPHEVVVTVTNPEIEETVMPTNFFEILIEQQIEDVIAYLLSLKVISPTSASPSG